MSTLNTGSRDELESTKNQYKEWTIKRVLKEYTENSESYLDVAIQAMKEIIEEHEDFKQSESMEQFWCRVNAEETKYKLSQVKIQSNITKEEFLFELTMGATFTVYYYTISVIVWTFNLKTGVQFIRSSESPILTGLPYTALTFLLGWWGLPVGPICTIQSILRNSFQSKHRASDIEALISLELDHNNGENIPWLNMGT